VVTIARYSKKAALSMRKIAGCLDTSPRYLLIFFALGLQIIAHLLLVFSPESWQSLFSSLSVIIWVMWFAVVFMMALPATDRLLKRYLKQLKYAALGMGLVLMLMGIGEVIGISLLNSGDIEIEGDSMEMADTYSQQFAYNDGTALIHAAADNFIESKNPYTEVNLIETIERFEVSLENVTPVREGEFAETFPYPTYEELDRAWQDAKANADLHPAEFESKLTYPSGSFLFTAPFVNLGLGDIRYFYLLCALLMFGAIIWKSPRMLWPLVILVACASLEMWNDIASGGTGSLYLLFLLLSWMLLPRNIWVSAAFMGLAVISKQLAWFFIPFYLILLLRRFGWQKSLQLGGVVGGIFILANIPYIVSSPQVWAESVFAPLADPMFPQGAGVITLAITRGLIPSDAGMVYALIEVGVLVVCLLWYYFNCRKYPDTGLVLAAFPLFFATRSYSVYFFPAAILVFAVGMGHLRRSVLFQSPAVSGTSEQYG